MVCLTQTFRYQYEAKEKLMILLISGPRSLEVDPEVIGELLQENNIKPDKIITGGAKGIDACAEAYANQAKIPYEALRPIHRASWGAIANNTRLAKEGDVLLAITDGASHGTADMITRMKKLGKPTFVYEFE